MSAPIPLYTVENGKLVVSDATGAKHWVGMPLDATVHDVKAVPGSENAVVLLDYMAVPTGPFRNLVCVDPRGAVLWIAPLPSASSTDAYVSFDLGTDEVQASSWNGYRVRIDLSTGDIRGEAFAK